MRKECTDRSLCSGDQAAESTGCHAPRVLESGRKCEGNRVRSKMSAVVLNPRSQDERGKRLLQDVLKLYNEELPSMSYAANTGKHSRFLERTITSGKYCTLVLKHNTTGVIDDVVAAITYQIIPADTQYAEIPLAAVRRCQQRKGFGASLCKELLERLENVGVLTAFCWGDDESEAFWVKQGFAKIAESDGRGRPHKFRMKADVRRAMSLPGSATLMICHLGGVTSEKNLSHRSADALGSKLSPLVEAPPCCQTAIRGSPMFSIATPELGDSKAAIAATPSGPTETRKVSLVPRKAGSSNLLPLNIAGALARVASSMTCADGEDATRRNAKQKEVSQPDASGRSPFLKDLTNLMPQSGNCGNNYLAALCTVASSLSEAECQRHNDSELCRKNLPDGPEKPGLKRTRRVDKKYKRRTGTSNAVVRDLDISSVTSVCEETRTQTRAKKPRRRVDDAGREKCVLMPAPTEVVRQKSQCSSHLPDMDGDVTRFNMGTTSDGVPESGPSEAFPGVGKDLSMAQARPLITADWWDLGRPPAGGSDLDHITQERNPGSVAGDPTRDTVTSSIAISPDDFAAGAMGSSQDGHAHSDHGGKQDAPQAEPSAVQVNTSAKDVERLDLQTVSKPQNEDGMSVNSIWENTELIATEDMLATSIGDVSRRGDHVVMFMNMASETRRKQLTKLVENLGGKVSCKGIECTHIVTGEVRTTLNFCTALCSGAWVVSSDWLKDSARQNHFVDPTSYVLHDTAFSMRYGSTLQEAVLRARNRPNALLQGFSVYPAPSTSLNFDAVSQLIIAAGGKVLLRAQEVHALHELSKCIMLASEEHTVEALELARKGVFVFAVDWFMSCVVTQNLDLSKPQFAESLN